MSLLSATKTCVYADFAPYLPIPFTRRYLLRLADIDRFPRYVRPGGRKSEPLFSRQEIADWYRERFGDLLPERVAEFEKVFTNSAKSPPRARSRREQR